MYRDRTINQLPESFAFCSRKFSSYKILRGSILLMLVFPFVAGILACISGEPVYLTEAKRYMIKLLLLGTVAMFFSCVILEFAVMIEDFLRLIGYGRSDHLVFSERKIEFKTSLIGAWNNLLPDEEKLATVSFNNEDLQKVVLKQQAGKESDFLFVFKKREILVKIEDNNLAESLKCYLKTVIKSEMRIELLE